MRFPRVARVVACCAATTLILGAAGMAAASADSNGWHNNDGSSNHRHDHDRDHHRGRNGAIFVSATGSNNGWGGSCQNPDFSTIQAGVNAAPSGGTVVVCAGTYAEDVLVNKALTLLGRRRDRSTRPAWRTESRSSRRNVRVDGFTVENANGEGVLVGVDATRRRRTAARVRSGAQYVTVEHNDVSNNDKGFNGTETGNCKYPGDCGGGLHFNGTTQSVARGTTS